MSNGTQISDMTAVAVADAPEDASFPFVVPAASGPFLPTLNYRSDIVSGINARVKTADLISTDSDKGDALVGSDDGSSGSLWTTVKGFIGYLMSSAGSAILGFLQAGTGAQSLTAQAKLRIRFDLLDFIPPAMWAAIADGSSTDDHTAYYLAAIDAAQAMVDNDAGAVDLLIPVGRTNITASVELKSISLKGNGAWVIGCNIYWMGAAGGIMFTKSVLYPGAASWGRIEDLWLQSGTNRVGTFLQINTLVDNGFRLKNVGFKKCTGNAIEVNDGWVNLHWEHLRWDGVEGYGIYAKPYSTQSLGSFVVDKFTYDSANSSADVLGVIGIDVSLNNSNLGYVKLTHGRIEINVYKLTQGIFSWVTTDAAKAGAVIFVLEDVTYADSASSTDSIVWGSRAGGGNMAGYPVIINFWHINLGAIIGLNSGTTFWGASTLIPLPTNGVIAFESVLTLGDAVQAYNTQGFVAVANSASTDFAYRSRLRTDTTYQFTIMPDGAMLWGAGGSSATDIKLSRGAPGVLQLGTGQSLRPTDATGQKLGDSTHQWQVYTEVIATASLPAAASAMDGTVLIEDAGTGDRNLILYAGAQRFRVDGGANF